MTEQPEMIPTGDNRMLDEVFSDRKITWLEKRWERITIVLLKAYSKRQHLLLVLF